MSEPLVMMNAETMSVGSPNELAPKAPETFELRLVSARTLSPTVRGLRFERVDGPSLEFLPGQWVNLVFDAHNPDTTFKRSYSIALPPPPAASVLDLAVTLVEGGPGSERLHAMEIGATLQANGPHGLFTRRADDPRPALFIATGSGIAPMRSMIGAALANGGDAPLQLLFGVRSEEHVLYRDELEAWAAEHPRFSYSITLSRPAAGWTGRTGYVQTHVAEAWAELAQRGPNPAAYICGLDRMVKTVRDLLRKDLKVDRRSVSYEKFD